MIVRFVCRRCGLRMAEMPGPKGGEELNLQAFGIEREDWQDWLRADLNDEVVVVQATCADCSLVGGPEDEGIWYN